MGVVADAVLAGGGTVTGVIPQHLWDKEVGHAGLTELLIVDSMHERKLAMADRADAFIALPGGVGTFEELFEAITWTQLGIHDKPVGLLDVAGFYAPAAGASSTSTVDAGFLRPGHREMITSSALEPERSPRPPRRAGSPSTSSEVARASTSAELRVDQRPVEDGPARPSSRAGWPRRRPSPAPRRCRGCRRCLHASRPSTVAAMSATASTDRRPRRGGSPSRS